MRCNQAPHSQRNRCACTPSARLSGCALGIRFFVLGVPPPWTGPEVTVRWRPPGSDLAVLAVVTECKERVGKDGSALKLLDLRWCAPLPCRQMRRSQTLSHTAMQKSLSFF